MYPPPTVTGRGSRPRRRFRDDGNRQRDFASQSIHQSYHTEGVCLRRLIIPFGRVGFRSGNLKPDRKIANTPYVLGYWLLMLFCPTHAEMARHTTWGLSPCSDRDRP